MTPRGDRGSATIWVLAFIALIVSAAFLGMSRTAAVLARHRVERAADLAALAAAEQIGRSEQPCAAATQLAERNGAVVTTCALQLDASARSGTVVVTVIRAVHLPIAGNQTATARARAGRLPP
jgi:secretion/DNA translocation related TadE-like protein